MATLEKIRSRAGLLVGVVGIALFAFIIGDFLNSGTAFWRQSQETVGAVDGERITIFDYEDRVKEMTNIYKMQYGDAAINDEMNAQIRRGIWDEMINEKLIADQTSELGLTVTTEELFDMVNGENVHALIRQIPIFVDPNTGMFSRDAMMNFLQMVEATDLSQYGEEGARQIGEWKKYWLFYEQAAKRARLAEKYNTLFMQALGANNLEAKSSIEARSVNADIEYAVEKYSTIADSTIKVTDSEIKAEYERKKDMYKTPAYRSINYLTLDIRPSEADFKESEEAINSLKQEFSTTADYAALINEKSDVPFVDAYVAISKLSEPVRAFVTNNEAGAVEGPSFENDTYTMYRLLGKQVAADSVKVRHIFVQKENEAATKALSDSIFEALKGGADFAALCEKYSLAQTKENGGELGWFTEETAVQGIDNAFKDACFAAAVNDYFQLPAGNGMQILQVVEKTAPVEKAKVATLAMEVAASSRTYSQLYNTLNQMVAKADNSGEKLAELAKEQGYQMQTADMLTANHQMVADLRDSRKMIQWAFENAPNAVSDIYDCHDRFAVAYVTEVNDDGYMPVKTVAGALKSELINKKKAEKLIAKLSKENINSIADAAKLMNSKADTAKFLTFNTRQITGVGFEPSLVGYASMAELNKVSKPIEGKNGVYVVKVFNRTEPAESDLKSEKAAIDQTMRSRIAYTIVNAMKEDVEIEDYRVRFF